MSGFFNACCVSYKMNALNNTTIPTDSAEDRRAEPIQILAIITPRTINSMINRGPPQLDVSTLNVAAYRIQANVTPIVPSTARRIDDRGNVDKYAPVF